MNEASGQTSETALAVLTFLAAAGSEPDLAVRLEDPFASRLIRWSDGKYIGGKKPRFHPFFRKVAEKSDPGAYGFMIARVLHIDDVVRQAAADGLDQLAILGAGYDTRAYRMREQLADVKVFEVDLPAMSADKRARIGKVLGSVPDYVDYVEVDFNSQGLFDRLAEHGYDESAKTLFVLSGVSMYLPEVAVLELFSQVAAHSSAGSSIVFDYFFDDLRSNPERYHGAAPWVARVDRTGEEHLYGVAMGEIGDVLASRGLRLTSQSDMTELAERYLRRTDGTNVARPYDFAAVAHAEVAA